MSTAAFVCNLWCLRVTVLTKTNCLPMDVALFMFLSGEGVGATWWRSSGVAFDALLTWKKGFK